MSKKMDKVKRKTESISDNVDMSDKERSREIKQVYKKAGLISKKKVDVKYIMAKKGVRGRTLAKGVKGPYKVVDKRLKKDNRSMRAKNHAKGKAKGKGKGKGPQKGRSGGKSAGGGGGGGGRQNKNRR